jgi:hypothetical protein
MVHRLIAGKRNKERRRFSLPGKQTYPERVEFRVADPRLHGRVILVDLLCLLCRTEPEDDNADRPVRRRPAKEDLPLLSVRYAS